ncbi:hypothetical protein TPSD3_05730 [Thioflexithrix psekupsensis]|uniref:Uncharacterized protein n=2 Tax=Thioflexithrix psekupsensis TaxID=1570016 RepID=A0A251X7Y9_9GAMM|nr:hypothetical protein TPSD3_05730 [Thioflexithrix psekupsensis]
MSIRQQQQFFKQVQQRQRQAQQWWQLQQVYLEKTATLEKPFVSTPPLINTDKKNTPHHHD